jgi:hypothetical protein
MFKIPLMLSLSKHDKHCYKREIASFDQPVLSEIEVLRMIGYASAKRGFTSGVS